MPSPGSKTSALASAPDPTHEQETGQQLNLGPLEEQALARFLRGPCQRTRNPGPYPVTLLPRLQRELFKEMSLVAGICLGALLGLILLGRICGMHDSSGPRRETL